MKIYITGAPGSGKTTLAKKISRSTGIPCTHLDEVMHEPDPFNPGDNRKRDPLQRDEMFREIISRDKWIIEDAGRACFREGQEKAHIVAAIALPKPLLFYRVLRRWLRQKVGLEKAQYKADMTMLRMMRKWVHEYELSDHLFAHGKTRILKNSRDIEKFLSQIDR